MAPPAPVRMSVPFSGESTYAETYPAHVLPPQRPLPLVPAQRARLFRQTTPLWQMLFCLDTGKNPHKAVRMTGTVRADNLSDIS